MEKKVDVEHIEAQASNADSLIGKTVDDFEEVDARVKALERSVGPKLAKLVPEFGAWYKEPHLLRLNLILGWSCLSSAANGYDNSLINTLQAFPEWQHDLMDSPASEWLGFIVISLSIGGIFGNVAGSYVSDTFGRRFTIRVYTILISIFALGQAFVKTSTQFIVLRVFIGFFAGFGTQTAVLLSETAFPTHRGSLTAFQMTNYYVGSFLAAWVAYGSRNLGDWSWRTVTLLQVGLPMLVAPIAFFYLPESPRWYVSKGRHDEARNSLMKIHGGDDPKYTPLIEAEFSEIVEQMEETNKAGKSFTFWSMFSAKENQWKTFISVSLGIFQQWNGVGVISYYLTPMLVTVGITSKTQQTLINGFLQFWNFICAALSAFNVDRLGRKTLFLWSTIGMLISYIIITGLSAFYAEQGNKSAGIAVVAFLFIYYGHYDIAFTSLATLYPCEIWPYQYRAKGIAVASVSTYAALLVNQFVNPIALEAIAWKYYFVFIAILIGMIAVIYFLYPETKGYSLEEIQLIFNPNSQLLKELEDEHEAKSMEQTWVEELGR